MMSRPPLPVMPTPRDAAPRRRDRRFALLLRGLFLLLCGAAVSAHATDKHLEEQRDRFAQAWKQVESGHVRTAAEQLEQLHDYPLAPYLERALLQARLHELPHAEVADFLRRHDGSIAADQLRRSWLTVLARRAEWQAYLDDYRTEGAPLTQRCWHLRALWETGRHAQAQDATTSLWMRADSLPSACDEPFRRWLASDQRTQPLIWQRLLLALQHDQQRLGRYLVSQLEPSLRAQGQRLLSVHQRPQQLQQLSREIQAGPQAAEVAAHALMRLARSDARAATYQWQQWSAVLAGNPDQVFQLRQRIARHVIARDDDALAWLLRHDPDATDPFLLEWRIRLALRQGQWREARDWITLLPPELADSGRWRYWQARALEALDQPEPAQQILAELARERHFYGFIAADRLSADYGLNHRPGHPSLDPRELENRPAIQRAREWLALDDQLAARREWLREVGKLDNDERQAAALLAHRWGWHDRSIHTALQADLLDDLEVRFPLAYPELMLGQAREVAIAPEWLFAVARQESAFVADARSPAGALGVLQLMPGTARQVAASIGAPHHQGDLLRPEHNVSLGSHYLAQLLREFGGNRILATAAYNAGPERIARVLQAQPEGLPFDIWIETLPYHETRGYIQNVLSFSVIYSHRLGAPRPLLEHHEFSINPAQALSARERERQPR